jgi:hypothetical protein
MAPSIAPERRTPAGSSSTATPPSHDWPISGGCNFVYNSRHSNSRMNLPRRAIAEIVQGERFFGSITETHSQPGKIERVARADGPASTASPTRFSAGIVRSSAS